MCRRSLVRVFASVLLQALLSFFDAVFKGIWGIFHGDFPRWAVRLLFRALQDINVVGSAFAVWHLHLPARICRLAFAFAFAGLAFFEMTDLGVGGRAQGCGRCCLRTHNGFVVSWGSQ